MLIVKNAVSGTLIRVTTSLFPGGEVHVRLENPVTDPVVKIHAILADSNSIMGLLMVTDALRRSYKDGFLEIELEIPYVPYARQDRVMTTGESLSIKVFADLINSQKYKSVMIWDPHSDVTPALINNCRIFSQQQILYEELPLGKSNIKLMNPTAKAEFLETLSKNTVLVSPDAGANKKIGESAKLIGFEHVVRADKVRNPKTGEITGTVVYSEHVGDKDFLIVDDICDGGRTFLELAKVLRPLTNGKIILYVTHGIFSKGVEVFKGIIDEVYCVNSFGNYPMHTNLVELNTHV